MGGAHPQGLFRAGSGPPTAAPLRSARDRGRQRAQHADSVGLSFVNTAADVEAVQAYIAALGARRPSLMLKIETRRGFEHLPEIVLSALASPCFGVMIARGDLAVECGFERLAEVQEEILWICEAAHVPAAGSQMRGAFSADITNMGTRTVPRRART